MEDKAPLITLAPEILRHSRHFPDPVHPIFVPVDFDFVGPHLTLVGEIGVPASGVPNTIGKENVLEDRGARRLALSLESVEVPIARPELLYGFYYPGFFRAIVGQNKIW
jgi:hypothetical protein